MGIAYEVLRIGVVQPRFLVHHGNGIEDYGSARHQCLIHSFRQARCDHLHHGAFGFQGGLQRCGIAHAIHVREDGHTPCTDPFLEGVRHAQRFGAMHHGLLLVRLHIIG